MRNYLQRRWSIGSKPGRCRACRHFTLIDAMILVGGAAVGLAFARSHFFRYQEELFLGGFGYGWSSVLFNFSGLVLMLSSLLTLTLRLRRPRPALRRVARQPGAAACFMAIFLGLGEAYSVLVYRGSQWADSNRPWIDLGVLERVVPDHRVAYAIAATWILFALGRIGRPEAGWVDRAGRIVGWGWIAWGVGTSFLVFYFA